MYGTDALAPFYDFLKSVTMSFKDTRYPQTGNPTPYSDYDNYHGTYTSAGQ